MDTGIYRFRNPNILRILKYIGSGTPDILQILECIGSEIPAILWILEYIGLGTLIYFGY